MSNKCKICSKAVYPMDPQINLDGVLLHKPCAKCADCKCQISLTNFSKHETPEGFLLLCKTHYFKRFREEGSYLGGDKFQVKATRDVLVEEKRASLNLTGQNPVTSQEVPKKAAEEVTVEKTSTVFEKAEEAAAAAVSNISLDEPVKAETSEEQTNETENTNAESSESNQTEEQTEVAASTEETTTEN